MAKFEFVTWLANWLFQQAEFQFDWDHGNLTKSLQKHGVTMSCAEELFSNSDFLVPLGIQISPRADEPRFGALGMDFAGNKLSTSFTIRNGKIRIISIRPMSSVERKKYASLCKK